MNLSMMEFRSAADYELYAKIRGEHPLFGEVRYVFRRELYMTGDSAFFHRRDGTGAALAASLIVQDRLRCGPTHFKLGGHFLKAGSKHFNLILLACNGRLQFLDLAMLFEKLVE